MVVLTVHISRSKAEPCAKTVSSIDPPHFSHKDGEKKSANLHSEVMLHLWAHATADYILHQINASVWISSFPSQTHVVWTRQRNLSLDIY